jgi:hypothetical protein
LVALIHRWQVEFHAGDTEGDCLARSRERLTGAALDHFAALLAAWQAAAYANQPPTPAAVAGLCAEWSRHFGTAEVAR